MTVDVDRRMGAIAPDFIGLGYAISQISSCASGFVKYDKFSFLIWSDLTANRLSSPQVDCSDLERKQFQAFRRAVSPRKRSRTPQGQRLCLAGRLHHADYVNIMFLEFRQTGASCGDSIAPHYQSAFGSVLEEALSINHAHLSDV